MDNRHMHIELRNTPNYLSMCSRQLIEFRRNSKQTTYVDLDWYGDILGLVWLIR